MTVRQFSLLVSAGVIQNLRTTNVTQTTIALAWDAYPGATAYQIRRNGTLVLTPTGTTYSNSGHTASTLYTYAVRPVVGGVGVASAEASVNVTTPSAGASPLFFDDFSTADFSRHNDYFRWGRSGAIVQPGNDGGGMIAAVSGPFGATVNAIAFRYSAALVDPEMRFHLTTSAGEVRTEGASNTVYRDVWLSYWLYVPSSYRHNSARPGISGNNNKGFATLWKDAYLSNWAQWAWDWIPAPGGSGDSMLRCWTNDRNGDFDWPIAYGDPNYGNWTATDSGSRIPAQPISVYAFRPVLDVGRWQHIVLGYKMSDSGSANGFTRIYRDGVIVAERTGMDNYLAAPINGLDRGYLFGYWNTVIDQPMTFYLTALRFGTTYEQVRSSAMS
jgi:hypothetical protein